MLVLVYLEGYRMRDKMKKNMKIIIRIITKLGMTRLVFTNKIYIRLTFTTSITPSIISRSREHTIGVTK